MSNEKKQPKQAIKLKKISAKALAQLCGGSLVVDFTVTPGQK